MLFNQMFVLIKHGKSIRPSPLPPQAPPFPPSPPFPLLPDPIPQTLTLNPKLKRQKHAPQSPVTLSVDSISLPRARAHTTIRKRARARALSPFLPFSPSFSSPLSSFLSPFSFFSLFFLLSLLLLFPSPPLSSSFLLFPPLSSSLLLSLLPSPPRPAPRPPGPARAPRPTLDAPILSRKTFRISPFPLSFLLLFFSLFPPSFPPSFPFPLARANFKTQPPAPKKSRPPEQNFCSGGRLFCSALPLSTVHLEELPLSSGQWKNCRETAGGREARRCRFPQ